MRDWGFKSLALRINFLLKMKKLDIAKVELERLYRDKGLNMLQIASLKKCNLQTIYRKMRRFNIPKRSFKSRTVLYKVKTSLNNKDKLLTLSALFLYWCEGASDVDRVTLSFTNSDPVMLNVWPAFLKNILLVPLEKIRIKIHIHKNQNGKMINSYWKNKLCLTKEILLNPYFTRKESTKKDYKGTVNIRVHSKFYYNLLNYWIMEIQGILLSICKT